MSHYVPVSKSYDDGDYAGDDDDLDEDGYDCLSDYDDDLDGGGSAACGEGPSTGSERRDNYASRSLHHHGGKSSGNDGGRHRSDPRRYRTSSDRVISDHADDNRCVIRRDHHNHLERKRRASIKGSYSELREAIPSLRGSKASRAVTLQRAVEYIETLTKSNEEHSKCVDDLSNQNKLLEQQIQELYHDYQCLEGNEYTSVQAAAVETSVAAATLTQAGPPAPFNTSTSPAPPTAMSSAASCNVASSTRSSTSATTPPSINGSYSNTTTSPGGFSIPLRVVPQHHLATDNTSPSNDHPPAMIPASGLAQLSYAALHLQQKPTPPNTSTVTKSPVSTSTVVATNPPSVARLITVESSAIPTSSSRVTATVPQRIRLSNSLSAGGGKPVVVVPSSGSSTTSVAFSALDTAVLKARTARPPPDHVVVGSNVEVVSSSSSNVAPSSSSGHPRRVVIVSAQHQECSSPDAVTQKQHSS